MGFETFPGAVELLIIRRQRVEEGLLFRELCGKGWVLMSVSDGTSLPSGRGTASLDVPRTLVRR